MRLAARPMAFGTRHEHPIHRRQNLLAKPIPRLIQRPKIATEPPPFGIPERHGQFVQHR